MKTLRKLALVLVAGATLGCSDEAPAGLSVADLVGTWTATSWTYRLVSNSNTSIDVVQLTFGATLTIGANGAYTGTLSIPGIPTPIPLAGTITINGTALTLGIGTQILIPPTCTPNMGNCTLNLDPADPPVFETTTLSGNTLTAFGSDYTWPPLGNPALDVNAGQPATLTIVLNRT